MVRLLRMTVRLAFRAAAIAMLVWVGRELIRRWVDGPDEPAVSGTWEGWEPPANSAGAEGAGSPGTASAGKLDGSPSPANGTTRTTTQTATTETPTTNTPAAKTPTAKSASAARKTPSAKAGGTPPNGTWVPPDPSGAPPASHPVKAKVSSRLYRVPGMPMYDRAVPDRCYASPEDAEADGFSRAKR